MESRQCASVFYDIHTIQHYIQVLACSLCNLHKTMRTAVCFTGRTRAQDAHKGAQGRTRAQDAHKGAQGRRMRSNKKSPVKGNCVPNGLRAHGLISNAIKTHPVGRVSCALLGAFISRAFYCFAFPRPFAWNSFQHLVIVFQSSSCFS